MLLYYIVGNQRYRYIAPFCLLGAFLCMEIVKKGGLVSVLSVILKINVGVHLANQSIIR